MAGRSFKAGQSEDYSPRGSRKYIDSENGTGEYIVHVPETPNNQPMDRLISQRVEEQYVTNSMFTGGHNSATRAHLMDKVIKSGKSHPQMAGAKGSICSIPGCDGNVMSDERGLDILPCVCGFKICRDCYMDDLNGGDGICLGCKEPYKEMDFDERVEENVRPLPLPSNVEMSKMDKRSSSRMEKQMSMMKSTKSKSVIVRSQTGDFDHNHWLFDTSGTYGYGNAIWPKDGGLGNSEDGGSVALELLNKPWKPLTRKLKIPAAVISPYRYNHL